MKKKIGITLIVLGFVLFISLIVMGCAGLEIQTKRAPCVDGDGDVNLEGIMCQKTYGTFFGKEEYNDDIAFLLTGLLFISTCLILLGVVSYVRAEDNIPQLNSESGRKQNGI